MILDNHLQLADAQALTATALTTNVIDLTSAISVGSGEPMTVLITIDVDADQTTGDEDYAFELEVASDAAMTTDVQLLGRREFESGTPTAPAQDADLLVVGYQFTIPVPAITADEAQRYLAVRATLAGTTPTITVTAHLQPHNMTSSLVDGGYPAGYTIS